jgi:DNA-binding CsgD family transcriptional regulator
MYVTALQTRRLSKVLELLTQAKGEDGDAGCLRQRLVEPVAELMNADYVASLIWDARSARFGCGVCSRADESHLRAYETEYQFTDPIAQRLHPLRYPTLVTQVIPQRELVKTEFFDRFLDTKAMYWGVNLYAHNGQRDVGDLRIWRAKGKNNFDAHELDMLRLIYPSLVNALTLHGTAPTSTASDLSGSQAQPILQLQQRHGLSPREAQVCMLVAQGHADKEIAKLAGMGFATVRTHLGNALRKTGCAHRKALIALVCTHHTSLFAVDSNKRQQRVW